MGLENKRATHLRSPARLAIEREIRESGIITFARFMEIALYGDHGYYSTQTGISRDYATSPHVHPAFGALIANHLATMWQALDEPPTFTVIELGAGDGTLMLDTCEAVSTAASTSHLFRRFENALQYSAHDIVARSEDVITDVNEFTADPGCVLSNELLDAFPAHRFVIRDNKVAELYVTLNSGGELVYEEDDPSTPAIKERVGEFAGILPEGYCGEVNLNISDWADTVARKLLRGYVLTIDYGHPRELLYHPSRVEGSLRCYRNHVLGQDPFRDIGEQDITTHVDFTTVDEELGSRGFTSAAPLTSQREFLQDIGIRDYTTDVRKRLASAANERDITQGRSELAALNALIDPRGLGSFQVAQHMINAPALPIHGGDDAIDIPLPIRKDRHLTY